MPIALQSRQTRIRVSLARLRAVARAALGSVGRAKADVHVTVVDDRDHSRLNARYLGSRKRTDVLAFDLGGPARRRCSVR
jgi:ssRNA-specific RNase YbeY (16S rRNA maturation enzyme)